MITHEDMFGVVIIHVTIVILNVILFFYRKTSFLLWRIHDLKCEKYEIKNTN